jgi:hypothetical protein
MPMDAARSVMVRGTASSGEQFVEGQLPIMLGKLPYTTSGLEGATRTTQLGPNSGLHAAPRQRPNRILMPESRCVVVANEDLDGNGTLSSLS